MKRKTFAAPKKPEAISAGIPILGQSGRGRNARYTIPKEMAALMTDSG